MRYHLFKRVLTPIAVISIILMGSRAPFAGAEPLAQTSIVTASPIMPLVYAKIAAAYPETAESLATPEDGFDGRPIHSSLSPDGTQLFAIVTLFLETPITYPCLFTLADESVVCFPYENPHPLRRMLEALTVWSPDGTAIVSHGDWVRGGEDPDLALYEVATGRHLVLTEDNYDGSVLSGDDRFTVDYAPFWSPDSQSIYYFSVNSDAEDRQNQLLIKRIPRTGGDPEVVIDLSGQVPNREFFYPAQVALSPDGRTVVIVTSTFDSRPQVNLWRVDLETGEASVWLDHAALYQATVPTWSEDPGLVGSNVLWSADGSTVVVAFESLVASGEAVILDDLPPLNYAVIDAATGSVHGVVDPTQWDSLDDYNAQGGFNRFSARFGLLTPDGQSLIYGTFDQTRTVKQETTYTVTLLSVPLAGDAAPHEVSIIELPAEASLLSGGITDRLLGQIAPNGLALLQSDGPVYTAYLLEFSQLP